MGELAHKARRTLDERRETPLYFAEGGEERRREEGERAGGLQQMWG